MSKCHSYILPNRKIANKYSYDWRYTPFNDLEKCFTPSHEFRPDHDLFYRRDCIAFSWCSPQNGLCVSRAPLHNVASVGNWPLSCTRPNLFWPTTYISREDVKTDSAMVIAWFLVWKWNKRFLDIAFPVWKFTNEVDECKTTARKGGEASESRAPHLQSAQPPAASLELRTRGRLRHSPAFLSGSAYGLYFGCANFIHFLPRLVAGQRKRNTLLCISRC